MPIGTPDRRSRSERGADVVTVNEDVRERVTTGPVARIVPRLRRPPHVGVTVLVRGSGEEVRAPLTVLVGGRPAAAGTFEAAELSAGTLLVEIGPDAFPWTQTEPAEVRLELVLGGRTLLSEPILVEPFQAPFGRWEGGP